MRSQILWSALLMLLLLVGTGYAAEPIGFIVGLQGDAVAVGQAGTERILELKSPIYANDTIRTSSGAKLQIIFNDDSLFSQGENTEVVIDRYVFNPSKKEENNFLLRILKGVARIVTGKITELNPDRFEVKTGRSTIGIRGCELGFDSGPSFDRIYVIRIPVKKSIQIIPGAEGASPLRVVDPGLFRVRDDGTILRSALTEESLRALSGATTPKSLTRVKHIPAEEVEHDAEEQFAQHQKEKRTKNKTQEKKGVYVRKQRIDHLQDDVLTNPQKPEEDFESGTGQNSSSSSPPPPPPPPALTLSGGGVGGTYQSAGAESQLDQLYVYQHANGNMGQGYSSVELTGNRYNGSGVYQSPASLSFQNIQLTTFGSPVKYEGFSARNAGPGVLVMNDNLQQFVVRIDHNNPAARMTYWGYDADNYPNSALAPSRVFKYDVTLASYPTVTPLPHNPNQELETAEVKVNTRTGIFAVYRNGKPTTYSSLNELQFYGEESQGVGGTRLELAPNTEPGKALAGYQDISATVAAETGGWNYKGYASGYEKPLNPAANAVSIRSADAFSDNPAMNEGRVQISLNRDSYQHNMDVNMNVHRNPSAPSPSDLRLGTPEFSGFLAGNDFGGRYDRPSAHIDMRNEGGGEDWSWGEWAGEREVDVGGGNMEQQETHGHYVVGNTLSPAAYQALYNGSASYTLQTPASEPGHAVATITHGNYIQMIEGESFLQVNIPGSGAPATWSGTFNMGQSGGDQLQVGYSGRPISANGHLLGTSPDSYSMRANGVNYGMGNISSTEITGNLVGPGSGPRPITGGIGSGQIVNNDGSVATYNFGAGLR